MTSATIETNESGDLEISYEQRVALTERVMELFSDWSIGKKEQMKLLGLQGKERMLTQLKYGTPVPDEQSVLQRVRHLIGIGDALCHNFPRTQAGGAVWLRHTNKYLSKRPPLTIMLEDGIPGLKQVWVNLDCTQGWD
ncbi:MAG: hypothetical protein HOL04_12180 [Gammaproteobacteria bacterium]|jgi:hypothetical protein|nr:hypothetical protein [Gammaproteobacteria bacterium]MBT4606704.1 hypothetical protein [Thiotrichales bacterium]MBT3473005.1 hypothetical protein [Gammaproteobacteria bacterium]MBT3966584.1 hypothetical protein [Gammaproteobacteria bacterium]MBT4080734.1 hypothetical protein [Gammaproteobacteria bacterium]